MTVPFTFATSTTPIPLSNLDANFAAIGSSENIDYTAPFTGGVAETVQNKLAQTICTQDFDTFSNAVSAAVNSTLIVNSHITISSDTIVPSTVCLRVEKDGLFNIATGHTLTINGCFDAGEIGRAHV